LPTKVLRAMFAHPLTAVGKEAFLQAWRDVPKQ
jgi:hypothetical protein